ncbi:MAG: hypothetical protein IJ391_03360 [Clostridia bacterium]|nr:hypothetical protein [Clostridia bacterium]
MNTQILNKLASVVNALNNIEVKGKANLMNLGGCIAIIEEVCQEIVSANENSDKAEAKEKK